MRVFLLTCLLVCGLHAESYYVNTELGNDQSGLGTQDSPWGTLDSINQRNLAAGDQIYLARGQRFNGHLRLDSADVGTVDNPIVIQPYGQGEAKPILIPSSGESGIYIMNTAGIEIRNLLIDGQDIETHKQPGIQAYVDTSDTEQRYEGLLIDACEIIHCYIGISVGAWAEKDSKPVYSGFDNVKITNCHVHHCRHDGITVWGISTLPALGQSHRNVQIKNCEVDHVYGDPEQIRNHSGSGIIVSGCNGALIEACYAHHNGGVGGRPKHGGPVGIWVWSANEVIIRRCLVHNQRTRPGAVDGGGFDIDGGARDCVIERCLSYDNQGPGYLIAEYVGAAPLSNHHIRYNISYNDGQANAMGVLHIWNGNKKKSDCENVKIYNNLFILGPDSSGPVIKYQSGPLAGFHLFNNMCIGKPGAHLVDVRSTTEAFTFSHNLWFVLGGETTFMWKGADVLKAPAWAAIEGKSFFEDPQLGDLSELRSVDSIAELDALSCFHLQPNNPLTNAGLQTNENSVPGILDFVGGPLKIGEARAIGVHDP